MKGKLEKILLLDDDNLDSIPIKILEDDKIKKYCFNSKICELLEYQNITFCDADKFLDDNERMELIKIQINHRKWYNTITLKNFFYENINLLKLLDDHEFGTFLMPILIKIKIIQKIINLEKPDKIICSNSMSNIVSLFFKSEKIQKLGNSVKDESYWDKITIKFNIGKIPISFRISNKRYLSMKSLFESFVGRFYNIWYKENPNKKSIIMLEFNTNSFSKLLKSFNDFDGEIILVNQRRSALWSKTSLNSISNSNCKIFDFKRNLTSNELKELELISENFKEKFLELFLEENLIGKNFCLNEINFYELIKPYFIKKFSENIKNLIIMLYSIKKLIDSRNIQCIVYLNEVGQTEKCFIEMCKNKFPLILLEHGFIETIDSTVDYDYFSSYPNFTDLIAVWGKPKKKYLISRYNINSDRIIVTGSPRHDKYFNRNEIKITKNKFTVLLAPNPLSEVNGFVTSEIKNRYNNTIKNIIILLNQISNIKIIVKLHPSQLKHNFEIREVINKLSDKIPIYLTNPVDSLIEQSDFVFVITPEIHATPTIVFESMILKKPIMNIYIGNYIPSYEHILRKCILSINDSDDLQFFIRKIILNKEFQDDIVKNSQLFINDFLENRGNASEEFAKILKNF